MDEEDNAGRYESLQPLKPVRLHGPPDGEPSTSALDGYVDGIDVRQAVGKRFTPTTTHDASLGKLMSSEMTYDEFLHNSSAAGDFDSTEDDDDEEEVAVEGDDISDEDTPLSPPPPKRRKKAAAAAADDEEEEHEEGLPPEVCTVLREVVSATVEDSVEPRVGEHDDRALLENQEWAQTEEEREKMFSGRARKLNKALEALLGQANVMYARGKPREALTMLLEVVRQEPRNPDVYSHISDIYHQLEQPFRALQYGLLAAHLNFRTSAADWVQLGDLASRLNRYIEAAACYGKAVHSEPTVWAHYEKRICALELAGQRSQAMRTRLTAAQLVSPESANLDFQWFHEFIRIVAEYYIGLNDEERAIASLEAFVLRARHFKRDASTQHDTLIRMWMERERWNEAGRSILGMCTDQIRSVDVASGLQNVKIFVEAGALRVVPFPPPAATTRFEVLPACTTVALSRFITILIKLDCRRMTSSLVDELLRRSLVDAEEEVVAICNSLMGDAASKDALDLITRLHRDHPHMTKNHHTHYILSQIYSAKGDTKKSEKSLIRVLELEPAHVDARINLSTLQQADGRIDEALETIRDYDLDAGATMPDERLLERQAGMLYAQGKMEQYVRCVRMMLTPYYYEAHRNSDLFRKKSSSLRKSAVWNMCTSLREVTLRTLYNSPFERFVKRFGFVAETMSRPAGKLSSDQLHDFSLRLVESLLKQNRYMDALAACSYAFLLPALACSLKATTFQALLFYCSIRAKSWNLAFEYVRWFHQNTMTHPLLQPLGRPLMFKRIFNAMNFVFCNSQSVAYHRYVMRALAKSHGNHALQMISGNNSLVSGSYRHALGEFMRVWAENRNNPLACLLVALTFTHMACKAHLCSRHLLATRGLAFLSRYETTRSVRQEVLYNMARVFHQMSLLPLARHFYEKCLKEPAPAVYVVNEDGTEQVTELERYDLRRFAAHNLAQIYMASGNETLALQLYATYCRI